MPMSLKRKPAEHHEEQIHHQGEDRRLMHKSAIAMPLVSAGAGALGRSGFSGIHGCVVLRGSAPASAALRARGDGSAD
jgi:hypothetical protein